MAKSWLVGGKITGGTYAAGTTNFFHPFSSIENTLEATARVVIPEALTLRNWAVKCGANGLSGDCTVVIRLNNTTDTALTVTFDETEDSIEKRVTGVDVAFAQNDFLNGKVVCEAGTGTMALLGYSAECEPDNSASTLSFLACTDAGATNHTTASADRYFAAFGTRVSSLTSELFDGTEETGIEWTSIGAFTAVYFQFATGSVTRTTDMEARTRKNGADGGCLITYTGAADQVVQVDTTGTDTLADGDDFDYVIRNGSGTGNNNIESIGCWLRSATGQFLLAKGNRGGTRFNAGVTAYGQMGGEGIGAIDGAGVEASMQLSAPFAMTISQMQVMSDRERNTGDSTATLRVDGVGTALSVTFPESGAGNIGIQEDSGSVAVAVDDLLTTQIVTGAGTNRDWCYVVYLAEAAATERRWLFGA